MEIDLRLHVGLSTSYKLISYVKAGMVNGDHPALDGYIVRERKGCRREPWLFRSYSNSAIHSKLASEMKMPSRAATIKKLVQVLRLPMDARLRRAKYRTIHRTNQMR
jgi:hypothetical protein